MRRSCFSVLLVLFCVAPLAKSADAPSPCIVGDEPMSLDFKDAQIADVMQFFQDPIGKIIVVDPCVEGQMTLKLENVPVQTVFDLILRKADLLCSEKSGHFEIHCKGKPVGRTTGEQVYEFTAEISVVEALPDGKIEVLAQPRITTLSGIHARTEGSILPENARGKEPQGKPGFELPPRTTTIEFLGVVEPPNIVSIHGMFTLSLFDLKTRAPVKTWKSVDAKIQESKEDANTRRLMLEIAAPGSTGAKPPAPITTLPSLRGGEIRIYFFVTEIRKYTGQPKPTAQPAQEDTYKRR